MKLSILIPTFNYDCTQLVHTLLSQLPHDAEIIVGDDCSDKKDVQARLSLLASNGVRVIRPPHNLGSAGMRNMLCREAKGEYLLYIDCDAIIEQNDFIAQYIKEMDGSVVCGTVLHPSQMPSPQQSLRWTYEKDAERKFTADKANRSPYQHFRTFHFLIPRTVMLRIPFDESIKFSGYEDLLFGKMLQEAGIPVRHTHIHATNGDIETNEVFIRKTQRHLTTLKQLKDEIGNYSTLLNFRQRMKRLNLLWLIRLVYKIGRTLMLRNLMGGSPSVTLFQLYKLGYYEQLLEQ